MSSTLRSHIENYTLWISKYSIFIAFIFICLYLYMNYKYNVNVGNFGIRSVILLIAIVPEAIPFV